MARNYVQFMIFNLIICAALLSFLFGEHGYLENIRLKRSLEEHSKQLETQLLDNADLQEQLDNSLEEDSLRDVLLPYGYAVTGEIVYRNVRSKEIEAPNAHDLGTITSVEESSEPRFVIDRSLVLILSTLFSSFSTIGYYIHNKRRKRMQKIFHDRDQEEGNDGNLKWIKRE